MADALARLQSLEPGNLQQLKERFEADLRNLGQSVPQLQLAASKFEESRQALQSLHESGKGHLLQLPLTGSLYVKGTIADTEKVLIDIGTGYYAEMSIADAQGFCKRKMARLTETLHQLQQIMREKSANLGQVNRVLAAKMRAAGGAQ